MTTFCHECGRYQGHEKTCSQSEQVTIDDLSHENTLVRARNERLEAEKVELLTVLRVMLQRPGGQYSTLRGFDEAYESAEAIVNRHTGSTS
jgi:hypothetical protein